MGKPSNKSKDAYNAKAYDQVKLFVPKGTREKLQEYASSKDMSLNSYIKDVLQADSGVDLKTKTSEK